MDILVKILNKENIMKYIFLLVIFIFTSCGYTLIPKSDYEVDNTSPYIIGVTWNANNKFDISRKTNSSFDEILNVTDEEASSKGKNYNVAVDAELLVTFSENMYLSSLFQYGVSESVVVIEGEPSKSFLSDIATPPLSDTNSGKILKVKVSMLSDNDYKNLFLDFSNAEDCVTDDDFKTKYCKLKKDTNYTLVISKKVVDQNGRDLVLKLDDVDKFVDENFVLLFRTTGTPPTVTSTQPQNLETDICLNLQEVVVNFSSDMDESSITNNSYYLSTNGNTVNGATLTVDKKSATLKLNSLLTANSDYKINLESAIRSKSRVNIEATTFTFKTATSASNQGPAFTQNPSATVIGNSITVTWATDVKSLADVKYGKGGVANIDYSFNDYNTTHSVTIDADQGPGDYTISITPKDRCGNISAAKTTTANILNHPLISEVSANPDSSSNEFVELYNDGDVAINLSDYILVLGTDEVILPNQDLPSKGYAVIVDSGNTLVISVNALLVLQDMDLTKSEDVFLKYNGINVDSYTYDLSSNATAAANLSAQRVDVTLRDSGSENYCESTPTPGTINTCQ
jgi:hypothetical protein